MSYWSVDGARGKIFGSDLKYVTVGCITQCKQIEFNRKPKKTKGKMGRKLHEICSI